MNALDLLSNLPTIIFYWTGITLSWGIFLSYVLRQYIHHTTIPCLRRATDRYIQNVLIGHNLVIAALLVLVAIYDPGIMDIMIVINTFTTCILIYTSVMIWRWHRSLIHQLPHPQ